MDQNQREQLGITTSKAANFPAWYQEVVTKAELIAYYNEISGFYITLPAAMDIWDSITIYLQSRFDSLSIGRISFPSFLHPDSLQREKDHVEGFAPELAWVTKAGDKQLDTPVAVRPTSEAMMYPYFAKWIRSWRNLPFRRNQWCNVVRWEAKQTVPFIRAREFLWQEGHTAHLTEELADEEVMQVLGWYAYVFEELLAVPVVKGRKTEKEKFAGAAWTATCEAWVAGNGRAVQGATAHALGQNFSRTYGIMVEDREKRRDYVWQNSWGMSTRVIGTMIMTHGDDSGLVVPPRVAEIQVVIVPVGVNKKMGEQKLRDHMGNVEDLKDRLKEAGIRAHIDDREEGAGYKFADWELKGVPLRLEFGPKDASAGLVTYARRDTGAKGTIMQSELAGEVQMLLDTVQKDLYDRADADYKAHRLQLTDWEDVIPALDNRNVVLIPFCEGEKCEDKIKEMTRSENAGEVGEDGRQQPSMGMKSLCIPFEQPDGLVKGQTNCLNPDCDALAKSWTMFGRSY